MLAKARVTCNYSGMTSVSMTLWRCPGSPQADATALGDGEWGCSTVAITEKTIPVSVGIEATVYCPDLGGPSVAEDPAYYIAMTALSNGSPSFSQEGWYWPRS
jgi:hypothetical protein